MKVTILGTGSSRIEDNCASEIIDEKILVDVGAGVVKQLLRMDYQFDKLEMVLISHLHADHYSDIIYLVNLLHNKKIQKPVYFIGPIGFKERIIKLIKLFSDDYFDTFLEEKIIFIEIKKEDEDKPITILKDYKIELYNMIHGTIKSYGFIINDKLGISGDTSMCQSIKEIIQKSQITITDISMVKGTINHLGVDDIKEIMQAYPNKKMIATHLRREAKEMLHQEKFENIILVEDGANFII